MKKFSMNFKIFVVIILAVFMGTSCSDDFENQDLMKARGDVFIKAYKEADTVVYERLFYAYSNYEMKNVLVTDAENEFSIALDTIAYKYTYAHIPSRDDYVSTIPEKGTYYFDVEFEDGTTEQSEDYLESGYVIPSDFTTLEWDSTSNKLVIEWEEVDGADFYRILLVNNEDDTVYDSDFIHHVYNRVNIGNYSGGWKLSNKPENGDSLKVIHTTYLFEYQISYTDVQCLAVNDLNTVVWGVN